MITTSTYTFCMKIQYNYKLPHPIRLTKRNRVRFFIISISLVLVCVILNLTYRPFIYDNHINDLYFADTFTNLLGVPASTCLCLALTSKLTHKAIVYVSAICMGLILYECIGLTFDYKDILVTLLSGIVTTILLSKSK